MKNTILIVAGIALLIFIHGCSSLKKIEENPQPDLLSGDWILTGWKGMDDLKTSFPVGIPIFKIDTRENTVSGFNGCNQLNGSFRYSRQAATIQFFSIATTRIFCQTVPELELTNAITSVNKYEVTTNKLILLKNKDIIMEFERIN